MISITNFIPKGRENAIFMNELAKNTGLDKRTVRKLVFNARVSGKVICSTSEKDTGGYYLPLNAEKAQPYYRQQLARINSATAALQSVINYIGGENI